MGFADAAGAGALSGEILGTARGSAPGRGSGGRVVVFIRRNAGAGTLQEIRLIRQRDVECVCRRRGQGNAAGKEYPCQ
ncbi:hypothetical protein D584_17870 [Brucella intermedia M86]|uniref:Uncharacterized protein n=1 Tax=Brucella intermedia M86 TaxID=1234597 RepID=M5JU46_9HYPH|nr:hypothetical protein D584_17870 [Brucella intermedia M86]